jgi:hypothetical protein
MDLIAFNGGLPDSSVARNQRRPLLPDKSPHKAKASRHQRMPNVRQAMNSLPPATEQDAADIQKN